jgi:hypothetical protein
MSSAAVEVAKRNSNTEPLIIKPSRFIIAFGFTTDSPLRPPWLKC